MNLHFSVFDLLDFPPYCSLLLTLLLRAVRSFCRKSTELSGGLFLAACLLLIAQHTFNPLPPAVGPSLFQMSFFLLSNHPTHSFCAGTPHLGEVYSFMWSSLISSYMDWFFFLQMSGKLASTFQPVCVLYYPISKPNNILQIFLKWWLSP